MHVVTITIRNDIIKEGEHVTKLQISQLTNTAVPTETCKPLYEL
jgi:hypothetical protein